MLGKINFWLRNLTFILALPFVACGSDSSDDTVVTPGDGGGAPSSPANVTAVAGNATVIVTWDIGSSGRSAAATDDCSNTVFIASSNAISPSNWNSIADGQRFENATPPKIISGLTNGKNYFVIVTRTCGSETSDPSPVVGPVAPTTGTTTSSTPSVSSFSPASAALIMSVGEVKTFTMQCVDAEDSAFNYIFYAGPVIKQHLPTVSGEYSYNYTAPNQASATISIACFDSTWSFAEKIWNITIPGGGASAKAPEILAALNARRTTGFNCGLGPNPILAPLIYSEMVATASLRHALDMAASGVAGIIGSDGSSPQSRLIDAGFAPTNGYELLASLNANAAAVAAFWFADTPSCSRIMSSSYTHVGAAWAENAGGSRKWVLDLAKP